MLSPDEVLRAVDRARAVHAEQTEPANERQADIANGELVFTSTVGAA